MATATIDFNQQLMPMNSLELGEIGQVAIEAWNDEGYYYYLIVRTSLGTCSMAECGPVVPDVDLLPAGFMTKLSKAPFKEDKLVRAISMWLNDRSKAITNAQVIDIDDAISQFRDLGAYLRNYGEDLY